MKKTVWHYTSESALQEIKRTKQFSPSFFKQTDTAYGEGWYVTDLPPTTPVFDLCDFLWTDRSSTTQDKTKGYVKLEIEENCLNYYRDHVYLLPLERVTGKVLDIGKEYFDNNNNLVIKFIEATLNSDRRY
jgi:hypothetical protein